MDIKDIVDKLLDKYSLLTLEKHLNKRYKDWNVVDVVEYLCPMYLSTEDTINYFKTKGDTYFMMSWDEFLSVCQKLGFEITYKQDFKNKNGEKEEEVVLIFKEKGLIIYANSFKGSINNAYLYSEIKIKEGIDEKNANPYSFHAENSRGLQPGTYLIKLRVLDGLLTKLNLISDKYEFLPTWDAMPNLDFLNYIEWDSWEQPGFDKEEITRQKIASMGSDAHEIMGFPSSKKI